MYAEKKIDWLEIFYKRKGNFLKIILGNEVKLWLIKLTEKYLFTYNIVANLFLNI